MRLARLHRRIKNVRQDYLHKMSTTLAKTKREIVIEDLCVKGLARMPLARSVSDVSWGMFRRMLQYKTKWYGVRARAGRSASQRPEVDMYGMWRLS